MKSRGISASTLKDVILDRTAQPIPASLRNTPPRTNALMSV
jgi:hypothetical protein